LTSRGGFHRLRRQDRDQTQGKTDMDTGNHGAIGFVVHEVDSGMPQLAVETERPA
jgi:hypothetical protein